MHKMFQVEFLLSKNSLQYFSIIIAFNFGTYLYLVCIYATAKHSRKTSRFKNKEREDEKENEQVWIGLDCSGVRVEWA